MKVAAIKGKRSGGIVDVADPQIKENYVKIKIHVAPMCTESKAYAAGNITSQLGHEAAGEVVEIAQPGKVKVGDRVVVMPQYPCGTCSLCLRGEYIHCENTQDAYAICGSETGKATYAQYMIKPDSILLPIPEGMSYEHASMACCGLGPTFGAMNFMHVDAFDTVLIAGMGPVGLGGVINGTYRGARVIAVEGHPYRRDLALSLGAECVIDPKDSNALKQVMDLTNGIGVDKAIDCTGIAPAQRFLIDAARRLGTVSFVGEGGDLTIRASQDMIRKGLNLHGSWHWNLGDAPQMMKMIEAVGDKIDKQITHTFPLSKVQDAWELQLTGNCGKVLLYPWK
jgi:L-iditol 2-dehydrogenase